LFDLEALPLGRAFFCNCEQQKGKLLLSVIPDDASDCATALSPDRRRFRHRVGIVSIKLRRIHLMKTRFAGVCQFLALTLVAACCLSVFTLAEDTMPAHPRFAVIPPKPALPGHENPSGLLEEWNGSFTYNGTNYPYVMVGADPSTNNGADITTWIIPVKLVLSDGSVWDPLAGGPNQPALARTILSPDV
jgi:hypothetical protein